MMRPSCQYLILAVALATGSLTLPAQGQQALPSEQMTAAARDFLKTLQPEQLKRAQMEYQAPQRVQWHFIPMADRRGLPLNQMTDAQRQAALKLVAAALSDRGFQKTEQIRSLEAMLAKLEKDPVKRDREKYYVGIYGEPLPSAKWGLSFEGHHLSLNFVVEGDRVASSTPQFLGANPAEVRTQVVPEVPKGLRVLAPEEDLAFDLFRSLTAEQKAAALIAAEAPRDIRAAGEVQAPREPAVGLAADKMSAEQQALLRKLIGVYGEAMPAEVAKARLDALESAGLDAVKFAWAGADKPGVGHYYRIQGPTFVIELCNTQPDGEGNPANHVHSVWRDMAGDFALPVK